MHDTHVDAPSDDEDLSYSPFASIQAHPNTLFNPDSPHDSRNPPIQLTRTRALREQLVPATAAQKVHAVLAFMDSVGLDLPLLLDFVSWGDQACTENSKINYERTALMVSKELADIIARWYKPPRSPGSTSARASGASEVLEHFAFDTVASVLESELDGVRNTMRCPADELTTEAMTGFQIEDLVLKLSSPGFGGTPKLWSLLHRLTHTKHQHDRQTKKNTDLVVLSVICQIEKSRSDWNSRFAKLVTTFLCSQGAPAKTIDLLRAFGLTMSHQWSGRALNQISANEMQTMQTMVQTYPFVLTHDNVNIPFHVFTQRLDNQNHFDSGTASTIFFQPNAPPHPPLSNRLLQEYRLQGRKTPLSMSELYDLANAAAPSQFERDIHRVLRYLLDSSEFNLHSYPFHHDSIFNPPSPVNQLPTGDVYATRQFMLGTEHIEEASYDGNDQVIKAIMGQLGLDSQKEQQKTGLERVIVWVGDQLTAERLRGLYKFHAQDYNSYDRLDWLIVTFGWFHLQMAFANSLHKQYLGTTAGRGLMHAFTLLERKGLNTVQTAGPFYQNLHDAILSVSEAHFRTCWRIVGKVESLSDLKSKSPVELYSLAKEIVQQLASSSSIEDIESLPKDEQDQELLNAILWNHDVLRYIDMTEAIRCGPCGDVGVMEQILPHLAFRFAGGGNSKYTIEILELLQGLHHEWPPEICEFICNRCWLVNLTGQPRLFLPLDKRQEYNIKAIKITDKVQGPSASWDLLKSRSPAIPMLQAIRKHMERQFPTLHRGKSHTDPSKEKDIQQLQQSYQSSELYSKHEGRGVRHNADMITDVVSMGTVKLATKKTLANWWNQRSITRATTEEW